MIRIGDLYVVDSGVEYAVELDFAEVNGEPAVVECESLAEAESYAHAGKVIQRRWYITAWEDYHATGQ